jgi:Domain of unknown function (DUF4189)
MRRLRAISVAVAVAALFPAVPSFAGYGAVAYDETARKPGYAWDEESQKSANEAAKRDCGSDACKVRFGVGQNYALRWHCPIPDPPGAARFANRSTRQSLPPLKIARSMRARNALSVKASATNEPTAG